MVSGLRRQLPVARVETFEMVGVEAVAEVGRDRDRKLRTRTGQALPHGRVAVRLLPHTAGVSQQLAGSHVLRLEYHVLAIVKTPVSSQDSILRAHPVEEWRAGK